MVGRAEERRLLEEQLRKLLRGEDGGVIIVEGEAGIGKSRLLEDLMQQAQELGVSTFLGEGDAIVKMPPIIHGAWSSGISSTSIRHLTPNHPAWDVYRKGSGI